MSHLRLPRLASTTLLAGLALVLAGALSPPVAAADATTWPFGGGRSALGGRDLWNLGLLGAKARDADRPEANAPTSGRTVVPGNGGETNVQPSRLSIEILFPGGPAEKAGLHVGDVVVGVGHRPFRDAPLDELAKALLDAEAGKHDGDVTLLVERGGDAKRTKVEVAIPVEGRAAAKPTSGAGRRAILDAATAWLEERQNPDGGFPQTLSGKNGAVVMASLAGLAWLATGSDTEEGPHHEALSKATSFVMGGVGEVLGGGGTGGGTDRWSRMNGMDQTNWGYAHAAIFLGELMARKPTPHVRLVLERCGKTLAERQEPSGGWAHGPGGPNPLGYTELNIVTGLALCGMGAAREAPWEPPQDVLDKAEAYLVGSSAGDGGVGYSDLPGQKGMANIGRTAAAWLAYRELGRQHTDWGRKMQKWVERNVGDVLGGHASLMEHVLLAGLAAHALGGKAKQKYWKSCETMLVLARAPDGSLQPTPWHESLSMGTNSDVSFGEVWSTAVWTIVLACEPGEDGLPGLPVWLGESPRR